MTDSPVIFIHVGYPKAASTSLQMNLFLNHPQVNYLGPNFRPPGLSNPTKLEQLLLSLGWELNVIQDNLQFWRQIKNRPEIAYRADDSTQKLYETTILPLIHPDRINVFSHEGLLNACVADNALKAKRIYEFFPTAKIIIILRSQLDALRSLHEMHPKDYLGAGTGHRVLSFNQWLNKSFEYLDRSYLFGLLYSETLVYYQQLFGPAAVGVFLFEVLKSQPQLFAQQLSEFMGIDATVTYDLLTQPPKNTAQEHRVHNFREKWLPGIEFSKVLPAKVHEQWLFFLSDLFANYLPRRSQLVSPENLARLQALYGPSNQRLMAEFGLEVEKYGYLL
jgi:hypothetical protein